MEETVEVILRAIDEATDTFGNVAESATDMSETISSSAENTAGSFEDVESSAENVTDAVDSIDGSNLDTVASGADNVSTSSESASDSLGEVSAILGGIAGVEAFEGIADSLLQMADAAGTFNDSMMRAGLEAEGAGISVGDMTGMVNDLSESTGRAGGQIREAFIKATARGVTDMSSFKTMMEGAGAQATLLGTDIETMGNKFSSMAQKDTLMARALAETGITMDELGKAMGMTGATADEVKAKWKELDTNQRAAILGTAASMNEGKTANDAYKNSWAGLNEKLNVAWSRLQRLAGEVLLPVLIPAIEIASRVLSALGDVISSVMSGPLGGLVSVIGSVAAAFALAVPAYMAVSAALTFITGPALAAAGALWAAVAPLLPFIAIGAAIVFIIYEIGKAFGWWTDVGSMLDAIWAGLQRLWSAFINHPDVQAAIQAITSALQWLWNGIVQAGQAVLDFFGINTGGDFDIVRALIDSIGRAWELVTLPIRVAIAVFQAVMGAGNDAGNSLSEVFGGFYNDILVPLGEFLTSVFTPVWNTLVEVFGIVAGAVGQLINAFTQFKNGQMDLPGLIMTVLSTLASMYFSILSTIGNFVLQWAGQLWGYAVNAGRNFLTGIISYVSQLPGRVYSYLLNVLQRVIQMGTLWVTNARNKALQLVTGVVSWLGQLPGKAYSALLGVVSQIVSAGAQWVSAAKEKAKAVVTGAYDTLTGLPGQVASALSGVVDAIVKPFEDAYNKAKEYWDKIKSLGTAAGGEAAGGDVMFAAGGEYSFDNSPISVENNVNLTLDLRNVPAHMSQDALISVLTDRSVIRELVNNSDFQLLDGKAKERLNLKVNRARGI